MVTHIYHETAHTHTRAYNSSLTNGTAYAYTHAAHLHHSHHHHSLRHRRLHPAPRHHALPRQNEHTHTLTTRQLASYTQRDKSSYPEQRRRAKKPVVVHTCGSIHRFSAQPAAAQAVSRRYWGQWVSGWAHLWTDGQRQAARSGCRARAESFHPAVSRTYIRPRSRPDIRILLGLTAESWQKVSPEPIKNLVVAPYSLRFTLGTQRRSNSVALDRRLSRASTS